MPRYALEFEWDGRNYAGTAIQATDVTLSSLVLEACAKIQEPDAQLRGSSRLDAGVSALALPAHVDLSKTWDCSSLGKALNAHLPAAVAVRRLAVVDADWDALRTPSVKHYAYRVLHRSWKPVLNDAVMYVKRLDKPVLLHEMAKRIQGVDLDLSGFACLRGDDTDHKDPRRNYPHASWTAEPCPGGQQWTFRISGSGFLYKQVRGLVGSMLAVAQGTYPIESFLRMCDEGRDSVRRDGNIAAAIGLCLQHVDYQQEPDWAFISWDSTD